MGICESFSIGDDLNAIAEKFDVSLWKVRKVLREAGYDLAGVPVKKKVRGKKKDT